MRSGPEGDDSMRSGPEPFDSPDVVRLAEAQQAEMLALYGEGGNDIGPAREASQFEPPRRSVPRRAGRGRRGGRVRRFRPLRRDARRAEADVRRCPTRAAAGSGGSCSRSSRQQARAARLRGRRAGDRRPVVEPRWRSTGRPATSRSPATASMPTAGLSRCLEKRFSLNPWPSARAVAGRSCGRTLLQPLRRGARGRARGPEDGHGAVLRRDGVDGPRGDDGSRGAACNAGALLRAA